MMRSLWTAASGMINQQINVDTISNNISNVNTAGFKKETVDFKTLLYQNIQDSATNSSGQEKPIAPQVGLGVRAGSITSSYTQGSLLDSSSMFDFAIEGEGFFKVQGAGGATEYTRNGNFSLSVTDSGVMLTNSAGNPLLDENNQPVVIPREFQIKTLTVDENGTMMAKNNKNIMTDVGVKIGLVQFSNPSGLEKLSGSMLQETPASGAPIEEGNTDALVKSKLIQQKLEGSNVQIVDEMVNLIVAQRAYEMSSKTIQASDTMLQQANNLRS